MCEELVVEFTTGVGGGIDSKGVCEILVGLGSKDL